MRVIFIGFVLLAVGCETSASWRAELEERLPVLGHPHRLERHHGQPGAVDALLRRALERHAAPERAHLLPRADRVLPLRRHARSVPSVST